MSKSSPSPLRARLRLTALEIALIYAALGILWILFSDRLVIALVDDPSRVAQLQTYKGWLFVLASAAVIYALVRRRVANLREAEARLATVLANAPIVFWSVDEEGIFTISEGAGLKGLGRVSGQSVGHSIYDLYGDVPEIMESVRRALAGEACAVTVSVGGRAFDSRFAPLRGRHGEIAGVVGVATDVTQRTELEERLHQSQKMEAIGRLAGGIAHDFNNILTAISGHTALLIGDLPAGDPRRDDVQEVQKAVDRAADLTRQLLAFSRRQVLEPRVLDLNAVVRDLEKMLRRLIGADIDCDYVLDPDAGRVRADPGQLQQVLMNLAANARDAMAEGGRMTIETGRVEFAEPHARETEVVQPGRYAMLAVSDTGSGIDAETQARIFEPFFTTKEKGKGTGLGLATVYGIVKQSGGHIFIYSERGHGTSFKIYLPEVTEVAEAVPVPAESAAAPTGTETVLVVEDDPAVLSLAARVLKDLGYTVLQAADGHAALAILEEHENTVALLVTDAVLPWFSGRELVRRARATHPDLGVLFISGYAPHATGRHGIVDPDTAFLGKPFTPSALAQKVRDVLDARAAG